MYGGLSDCYGGWDVMETKEDYKKPSYIFPDFLGDFMSKIDTRVQLEASMMSMTLMMCGLVISGIYVTLYIDFPLWYKIVLVINILAGLLFMSSFLVTSFQQYRNYMEVQSFQKTMKGGP